MPLSESGGRNGSKGRPPGRCRNRKGGCRGERLVRQGFLRRFSMVRVGEAFSGVQMAWTFQCSCRAGFQATAATAATVLLWCVVMIRLEGSDDFSQEKEEPFPGIIRFVFFPIQPRSGFPGPIAFEDGSGVGEKAGGCYVCLSRSRAPRRSQKDCPLRSIPFPPCSRAERGNRAVHSSLNISLTTRW